MRQGVKGFMVLDVPLGPGLTNHSFYLKEHSENKVNKTSSTTLFVGNVHYQFNLTNENIHDLMHDLFSVFGDVESVSLSDFPIDCSIPPTSVMRNAAFAHVEFKKKSALKAALSINSSPIYDEIKEKIVSKWGFKHLTSHKRSATEIISQFKYTYESREILKADASEYLHAFEMREAEAEADNRSRRGVADDDGFVQVISKKRIRLGDEVADGASGTGPQSARDSKKKKKDAELQNFYRFQQKRDRQNKLEGLRQQFEDDKKRVALLKANRKFKPF